MMNIQIVNSRWMNMDTGEILSDEQMALLALEQSAAEKAAQAELAKADLAELQQHIQNHIKANFPELETIEQRVRQVVDDAQKAEDLLRQYAIEQFKATGAKASIGGTVTITEAKRVTYFDPATALEWCDEMQRPDLVTRTVDKKALEKLARSGELPTEVMRVETVAETRLNGQKLMALAQELAEAE